MTLEEEILEASEKYDAFLPQQMINLLKDRDWHEHGGRHYLADKDVDPLDLFNLKYMLIDNRGCGWHSVDTIMKQMKNNVESFGSLFRCQVIAGIGSGTPAKLKDEV